MTLLKYIILQSYKFMKRGVGGFRLGELLNLTLSNVNIEQQLLKVLGKTGERIIRIGTTSAKALLK